jgi:hypothetical protein
MLEIDYTIARLVRLGKVEFFFLQASIGPLREHVGSRGISVVLNSLRIFLL